MRAPEGVLEADARVLLQPQFVEPHRHRPLVEDAQHDRLAHHEREGHHAQVHLAMLHGQPDAPVLGEELLRDVQLGHDLEPRDDPEREALGHGGGVHEHAVDAEAHRQLAVLGFEVDVRGALVDRLGHEGVHELDHRRVLGDLAQVDDLLVLLLDLLHRVVELVDPGDQGRDRLAGGHGRAHAVAGQHRDVVHGEHVGRVGHGHDQRRLVDEADRDGLEPLRRGGREQADRGRVDLVLREVDVVHPEALRHRLGQLVGSDGALGHQHVAGGPAVGARDGDGVLDLLGGGEPGVDDDLADQLARAGRGRRCARG